MAKSEYRFQNSLQFQDRQQQMNALCNKTTKTIENFDEINRILSGFDNLQSGTQIYSLCSTFELSKKYILNGINSCEIDFLFAIVKL